MLKRLVLAAVIPLLPSLTFAQGAAASAAVCDGSAMHHAEAARSTGRALMTAVAVVDVAAILTIPRNPDGAGKARSHFGFIAATIPVGLAGVFIAERAKPGATFWQDVISRLKVGETRASDVQLCLHRPDISTSSTTGAQWTYVMANPSAFDGSRRTVRLTFRDSVLADVERTEVNELADARPHGWFSTRSDRYRGYCTPPIPVVADPIPTPADTSAAAAALARAQADAHAASQNAAAAAAYAACMASDSAR